jgi:hypothetical protein
MKIFASIIVFIVAAASVPGCMQQSGAERPSPSLSSMPRVSPPRLECADICLQHFGQSYSICKDVMSEADVVEGAGAESPAEKMCFSPLKNKFQECSDACRA